MLALLGFPDGSAGKESACSEGELCSISGLGRSPGEGKGYPLQYSGLENSIDCIVYGVSKSRTRLTFTFFCPECPVELTHLCPFKTHCRYYPFQETFFSDSAKYICLLQLMGLQSTLIFPAVTSLIPSHWGVCVCIYL